MGDHDAARDGIYLANCKEKNPLSTAMNGHDAVYTQASAR